MASRKKIPKNARLPSAPLAEVVFELRWALHQGPAPGSIMNFDPMLIPLLHNFSAAMEEAKFSHSVDLAHPLQTGPYGVVRRYLKNPESPFPIMQVGAGIFATNESAQYEWKTYKAQILEGIKLLVNSYPTSFGFSLQPNYLELRYIDVFDKTVLRSSDFFRFTETGTSLKFNLPQFLENHQIFWGEAAGRFLFQRSLRGKKESLFRVELASAQSSATKENIVQLESKVTTAGVGVPVFRNTRSFVAEISKWLEFAHGVTSPFFKGFILPDVMTKFKRP